MRHPYCVVGSRIWVTLESHTTCKVYIAKEYEKGRNMSLLRQATYKTPKHYEPYKLYSCNKTNEMRQFLKFIFGIELYMFRRGFLSIIESLVLYTQQ